MCIKVFPESLINTCQIYYYYFLIISIILFSVGCSERTCERTTNIFAERNFICLNCHRGAFKRRYTNTSRY